MPQEPQHPYRQRHPIPAAAQEQPAQRPHHRQNDDAVFQPVVCAESPQPESCQHPQHQRGALQQPQAAVDLGKYPAIVRRLRRRPRLPEGQTVRAVGDVLRHQPHAGVAGRAVLHQRDQVAAGIAGQFGQGVRRGGRRFGHSPPRFRAVRGYCAGGARPLPRHGARGVFKLLFHR